MVVSDPIETIANEPTRFGKYLLDRRLAVGGMSEVYLARPADGKSGAPTLVIKRLLPGILDDSASRSTFAVETRLHMAIRHANVVEVFEAGEADGEPYLAMEYVPGVDAFRLMRAAQLDGERLPAGLAVYITREICKALACVHRLRDEEGRPLGIIHRDVTPSNIYLSESGDVKLGDFGIARSALRTARPTASHVLKGKYAYLAPEQVAGEPFDHRADLFSLAAVLTEMLIGRPLFSGSGQLAVLLAIRDCRLDALYESAHLLPKGLLPILEKGLSKSPAKRIASADELYASLAEFERPARSELRLDLTERVKRAAGKQAEATAEDRGTAPPMHPGPSLTEPVSEVRIVADPDATAQFPGPGVPDYAVLISEASVLDALAWVLQRRETGALFVIGGPSEAALRELYFRAGQLIHVASNDPDELLGDYLVRRGTLERTELEMALLAMSSHGGRLDQALLDLGLVDPPQLLRAARRQARDRVVSLFSWHEGRVSFYRDAAPEGSALPLDLDIPQLMLAGLETVFAGDALVDEYQPKLDRIFSQVRPPPSHAKSATWPSSVLHVVGASSARRTLREVLEDLRTNQGMSFGESLRALTVATVGGILYEEA